MIECRFLFGFLSFHNQTFSYVSSRPPCALHMLTICYRYATPMPPYTTLCHPIPPYATLCHPMPPPLYHPPMPSLCHPYATLCHPYATPMPPYANPMPTLCHPYAIPLPPLLDVWFASLTFPFFLKYKSIEKINFERVYCQDCSGNNRFRCCSGL